MPDLSDGESAEIQGSARSPYVLKNIAGVYSCSCPAWRNQSLPIDRRTCKHLRQYRGEDAERRRLGELSGTASNPRATKPSAPALLLAETWDTCQDLTGWWLSEKLDGVRAWWDGTRFLSRQGNVFHAPAYFTAGLPAVPLDGELWLGRKAFQRTVSIVRRHEGGELWRELRYLVFDMPHAPGGFEARQRDLEHCLADCRLAFALPVVQDRCRNVAHLQCELSRVESLGGEGLMLRQPGSHYETRRSPTLLKIKRMLDAEAQVIDYQPGSGRHKGRLGALLVELPNGTRFSVGTGFSDAERDEPPTVGSTITFRYQELSDRGVPRFPSFVRVAHAA